MGMEYKHYIVPIDPHYSYGTDIAEEIAELLISYGCWPDNYEEDSLSLPHGASVQWIYHTDCLFGEEVADTMGPSIYEGVTDEDRYVQGGCIVFGDALKLHPCSETIDITSALAIPIQTGHEVLPIAAVLPSVPQDQQVSMTCATQIPHLDWFKGYWTSAIMLDLGKDIPAWADTMRMSDNSLIEAIADLTGQAHGQLGHLS